MTCWNPSWFHPKRDDKPLLMGWFNPYKWPYTWVTRVIIPIHGLINPQEERSHLSSQPGIVGSMIFFLHPLVGFWCLVSWRLIDKTLISTCWHWIWHTHLTHVRCTLKKHTEKTQKTQYVTKIKVFHQGTHRDYPCSWDRLIQHLQLVWNSARFFLTSSDFEISWLDVF